MFIHVFVYITSKISIKKFICLNFIKKFIKAIIKYINQKSGLQFLVYYKLDFFGKKHYLKIDNFKSEL